MFYPSKPAAGFMSTERGAPPVNDLVVTTEFSDMDYGTLQMLKFEVHAVKESAIDVRNSQESLSS